MSVYVHLGDFRKTLKHISADLILTSPPYNIGSKSPRQDGQRCRGKFDPKSYGGITGYSDNMSEVDYQKDQINFFIWCADHLAQDGTLIYNHKPRRNGRMILPAEWFLTSEVMLRLQLMEEVIWDRGSTHNHSPGLMWPHTERLYIFKKMGEKYRLSNREGLPYRCDVWRVQRAKANGHNAPFPLELAEGVLQAWSQPGDMVCDPYLGSGTTGVAAKRLGRHFEGSERLKKYHKIAEERIRDA